jgi:hypothetical protein
VKKGISLELAVIPRFLLVAVVIDVVVSIILGKQKM